MKFENLKISSGNPDWCGSWKRADVEAEMKDLGLAEGEHGAWNWVLDHVFDGYGGDLPDHDRFASLVEDGTVKDITLRLEEGFVWIRQY